MEKRKLYEEIDTIIQEGIKNKVHPTNIRDRIFNQSVVKEALKVYENYMEFYTCDSCGKPHTGEITFTICDACWRKKKKKK